MTAKKIAMYYGGSWNGQGTFATRPPPGEKLFAKRKTFPAS
jgi:hypothetical protein